MGAGRRGQNNPNNPKTEVFQVSLSQLILIVSPFHLGNFSDDFCVIFIISSVTSDQSCGDPGQWSGTRDRVHKRLPGSTFFAAAQTSLPQDMIFRRLFMCDYLTTGVLGVTSGQSCEDPGQWSRTGEEVNFQDLFHFYFHSHSEKLMKNTKMQKHLRN